ncbi:hypothetical protein [Moorena sp. SIO3I6]|uniref:hypothetical protein n=1 Tax=Moorena sp. SIO3I6 TaxID=2607831 RepID=UPI0025E699B6|nr:hypothetical protein [Moorena sp. SIO3I6]
MVPRTQLTLLTLNKCVVFTGKVMARTIRRINNPAKDRLSYLEKSEAANRITPFGAKFIVNANRVIFKGIGSIGLVIVTTAENLLSPNGCLFLGGVCAIAGLVISTDTYYQQITGVPLLPFFEETWIDPVRYRQASFWFSFQFIFSSLMSLVVDWIQSLALVSNLVPQASKLTKTQKMIVTRIGLFAYAVELLFTFSSRGIAGLDTYRKISVFLYNLGSIFGAEAGFALAAVSKENLEKAAREAKSEE